MSDIAKPWILQQDAVYWPYLGQSQENEPSYGAPVQIKVRWQERGEAFVDRSGITTTSSAKVYVDRVVTEKGAIQLGELGGVQEPDAPFDNPGVWEIKKFNSIPNQKATKFLRFVYL